MNKTLLSMISVCFVLLTGCDSGSGTNVPSQDLAAQDQAAGDLSDDHVAPTDIHSGDGKPDLVADVPGDAQGDQSGPKDQLGDALDQVSDVSPDQLGDQLGDQTDSQAGDQQSDQIADQGGDTPSDTTPADLPDISDAVELSDGLVDTLTDTLPDETGDLVTDTGDLDDETDAEADVEPEIVEPVCEGYPSFDGTFCTVAPSGVVPGLRLMLSLTGTTQDSSVCGTQTWKMGNRILLQGTTPDGMARGLLTGAQIYYDLDEQYEDDLYVDANNNPASYPFIMELLDQNENVIWRGRRREPLQVREYIFKALESNIGIAPATWMVPLVANALGGDFEAFTTTIPDLPQAHYLRFSREWNSAEKASVTNCDTSAPLVLPAQVKSTGPLQRLIPLSEINQVPLSLFTDTVGTPEVVRIAGQSPPETSLNLVVLSDGYTADQKALFVADAQGVADYLATLGPFDSFTPFINVWRVWTPSPEPGASYDCGCTFFDSDTQDCTSPHSECADTLRSSVYGSVFAVRALYKINPLATSAPSLSADRNIFPMGLFRVGMAMSLSAPDGTPISGDAAFVLIKEEKDGAFGLFNAAVTTAYQSSSPDYLATVATHELGHAFGLLGDEYSTSTDVCQLFELTPLFPNFSPIVQTQAELPWASWATMDGPFPSSTDQGTADDVGCFTPPPGGGICKDEAGQSLLCRPMKTCKMKTNGGAFCPVCQDHLVHRIFNRIDVMASELFQIEETASGFYTVDMPLNFADVESTWTLDGTTLQAGPYASLLLDTTLLQAGEHTLELTATYSTPLVRVWTQALTETRQVRILLQ